MRKTGALVGSLLALSLGYLSAFAAEVTVEVSSETITTGDQLSVSIKVEGSGAGSASLETPLPKGKNLIPAGGVSTSSQMSIVNGEMSSSKSFEVTYLPTAIGAAELPSFIVVLDGQKRMTKPLSIKVVDPRERPSKSGSSGAAPPPVFAEGRLARDSVFEGETVTLDYVLLSRVDVRNVQRSAATQFPGFLAEEVKISPETTARQERGPDGGRYNAWTILRFRLTPTRAGLLEIPAVPLEVVVVSRSRDTMSFFFDRELRPVNIAAPAQQLDVKPLPELGRPSDFSGAVGSFKLTASLSPTKVEAGQASTLTIDLSGTGSLATATPPALRAPADVDLFDLAERKGSGSGRSWTIPIVPRTAGKIEFPPLEFSYFDPTSARYERSLSAPLTLEVSKSTRAEAAAPPGAVSVVEPKNRELGPFPTLVVERSMTRQWSESPAFWLLLGLPWLVAAAIPTWGRIQQHPAFSLRSRRARRQQAMRRHLTVAEQQIKDLSHAEAAREILLALHVWASDRIGTASLPLTRAQLRERLGTEQDAVELFERAEQLRYAGGGEAQQLIEAVRRRLELS